MKCFNFINPIYPGSGHLRVLCEKAIVHLAWKGNGCLVVRGPRWHGNKAGTPAGWGWIITDLTKMSKTEWVLKAVAHSMISFIFSIFPWLCKIIRNKRKICWMPSHSLLEQGNKPFHSTLWFAVSGRITHRGESKQRGPFGVMTFWW